MHRPPRTRSATPSCGNSPPFPGAGPTLLVESRHQNRETRPQETVDTRPSTPTVVGVVAAPTPAMSQLKDGPAGLTGRDLRHGVRTAIGDPDAPPDIGDGVGLTESVLD